MNMPPALALMLVVAGQPAFADPSADDRTAIQTTISGQIEAFRREDGAAAFAFAAEPIRAMFGTPEAFIEMVKRAYAPVYRPKSVVFGSLAQADAGAVQEVLISDADGAGWVARYVLARGPDGGWRIAGCTLLRSAGAAI